MVLLDVCSGSLLTWRDGRIFIVQCRQKLERDTVHLGTTRQQHGVKRMKKIQVNKSKLLRECHNKRNKCNYGTQHLEEVDGSFSRVTSNGRTWRRLVRDRDRLKQLLAKDDGITTSRASSFARRQLSGLRAIMTNILQDNQRGEISLDRGMKTIVMIERVIVKYVRGRQVIVVREVNSTDSSCSRNVG